MKEGKPKHFKQLFQGLYKNTAVLFAILDQHRFNSINRGSEKEWKGSRKAGLKDFQWSNPPLCFKS